MPPAAVALDRPEFQVRREGTGRFSLTWSVPGPVDVFVAAEPDEPVSDMAQLAKRELDGHMEIFVPLIKRPYFLLHTPGRDYRAAERLLPLEGGSNFRDLGGYPADGDKHVRWGLLFRSGAMPKLTDADYDLLSGLDITSLIDLRSTDEQRLSPTRWRAKPAPQSLSVNYPGELFFTQLKGYDGPQREVVTERLYAELPTLLREEYRAIFAALLARRTPLVFYGSGGQDRTGIATALILSALGVPRDVIYEDYLLSIEGRRPGNEISDVNLEEYAANNAEARFLIAYRDYYQRHHAADIDRPKQQRLRDSKGRPLLQVTFERIEAEYGSVGNYLEVELGVNAHAVARLQSMLLE
jgi:protein-tyrosine phosphatase